MFSISQAIAQLQSIQEQYGDLNLGVLETLDTGFSIHHQLSFTVLTCKVPANAVDGTEERDDHWAILHNDGELEQDIEGPKENDGESNCHDPECRDY